MQFILGMCVYSCSEAIGGGFQTSSAFFAKIFLMLVITYLFPKMKNRIVVPAMQLGDAICACVDI